VASAVRGPWGGGQTRTPGGRRVGSHAPQTNRASSSQAAIGGAPVAAGRFQQRHVEVSDAPLRAGRGRSRHRASPQSAGAAVRIGLDVTKQEVVQPGRPGESSGCQVITYPRQEAWMNVHKNARLTNRSRRSNLRFDE